MVCVYDSLLANSSEMYGFNWQKYITLKRWCIVSRCFLVINLQLWPIALYVQWDCNLTGYPTWSKHSIQSTTIQLWVGYTIWPCATLILSRVKFYCQTGLKTIQVIQNVFPFENNILICHEMFFLKPWNTTQLAIE